MYIFLLKTSSYLKPFKLQNPLCELFGGHFENDVIKTKETTPSFWFDFIYRASSNKIWYVSPNSSESGTCRASIFQKLKCYDVITYLVVYALVLKWVCSLDSIVYDEPQRYVTHSLRLAGGKMLYIVSNLNTPYMKTRNGNPLLFSDLMKAVHILNINIEE